LEAGAFEMHVKSSPNDNTTAVDVRIRSRKRAIASPYGLDSRILAAARQAASLSKP
jgi:hypothetical protein